MKKFTICNT